MKGWRYKLVDFGKTLGMENCKYLSFCYYDDQHFYIEHRYPVLSFEIYGENSSLNKCDIIRMERKLNNHFITKNIKQKSISDLFSESVKFIIDDGYDVDLDKVPSVDLIKRIIDNELK